MSRNSFTELWVHLVFSTKNLKPLLTEQSLSQVLNHMRSQLSQCGCLLQASSGMPDHVHLVFRMNPSLTLNNVVQQVKGNTSHWINMHELTPERFAWQQGFNAWSVSHSELPALILSLSEQLVFHRKKSYLEEIDDLIVSGMLKQATMYYDLPLNSVRNRSSNEPASL